MLRRATIVGAVRSTLIPLTEAVAWLPARSVTVSDADWLTPSPNVDAVAQPLIKPESESPQEYVTVTGVLFQPSAFGATLRVAVTVGAVSSMLIGPSIANDELPARSVTLPVAA